MQLKKAISVGLLASIFSTCLYSQEYKYTNEEVYTKMCSKCHGLDAQGNPKKKGPALNDQSAHELEISLFDLKSGGLNQSSGTNNEVMEHNMQKIIDKGYDYDAKGMSDYIFISFNSEAKYYKKISNNKNKYTVSEIYSKMCSKCHGIDAQGNPKKKGPALNDQSVHELENELLDILADGLNQSSGSDHDVMEHNQEKILKKGMKYNAKEMAEYIHKNFNK